MSPNEKQHWGTVAIIAATILVYSFILYLINCGGESTNTSPPGVAHVLTWDQPPEWSDGSPMDLWNDVERYDIYCSETAEFIDNNVVASTVGATVGNLIYYFDLDQLPLSVADNCLWLTVKTVAYDGTESEFAEPIEWEIQWPEQ